MSFENFSKENDEIIINDEKNEKNENLTEQLGNIANSIQELCNSNTEKVPNQELYDSLKNLYNQNKDALETIDPLYRTKANVIYFQMLQLAKTGSLDGNFVIKTYSSHDGGIPELGFRSFLIKDLHNNSDEIENLRKSYIENQLYKEEVDNQIKDRKVEIDFDESFSVYPNPCGNEVNIKLKAINTKRVIDGIVELPNSPKIGFNRDWNKFKELYIENTNDVVQTQSSNNGSTTNVEVIIKETPYSLFQYKTTEEKKEVLNSEKYSNYLSGQLNDFYKGGFKNVSLYSNLGQKVASKNITLNMATDGYTDQGEIKLENLGNLSDGVYRTCLNSLEIEDDKYILGLGNTQAIYHS